MLQVQQGGSYLSWSHDGRQMPFRLLPGCGMPPQKGRVMVHLRTVRSGDLRRIVGNF